MSLQKKIQLTGDKSISHRALMLAAITGGTTQIKNLCNSEDLQSTIDCLRACGVNILKNKKTHIIDSDSLSNPSIPLNCGNSGTTIRLLTGLLAGQNIEASLYGDASLMKRPMDRVIDPLKKMGANADWTNNQIVLKKSFIKGGEILNPTSSAQVKSSIILAALGGEAKTILTESYNTRDHTERMISFYNPNSIQSLAHEITITPSKLGINSMEIPGDISKASFFIAYACLTPGSNIVLENILINPRRIGFISALKEMGANITIDNKKIKYGEPVGNVHVKYKSRLKNIRVRAKSVRDMVDEIPILSIVAALSRGVMSIEGLSELKLKESNRVLAITSNLKAMGSDIRENNNNIMIKGQKYLYNTNINTFSDHRIAMAFYIGSFFAKHTMILDNIECIKVSFPDFFEKLEEIRA